MQEAQESSKSGQIFTCLKGTDLRSVSRFDNLLLSSVILGPALLPAGEGGRRMSEHVTIIQILNPPNQMGGHRDPPLQPNIH